MVDTHVLPLFAQIADGGVNVAVVRGYDLRLQGRRPVVGAAAGIRLVIALARQAATVQEVYVDAIDATLEGLQPVTLLHDA